MMRRLFLICALALIPFTGYTQGTIAPIAKHQFFTNAGAVAASHKLCSWQAGTTTPLATYSNSTLTAANTNPIILDSAGRATIFLQPGAAYKFALLTAGSDSTCDTGSTLWTVDGVTAMPASTVNLDIDQVAGEALSAGDAVFLSDGSGGRTAGRWYKSDSDTASMSSTATVVAMVPAAISSGATGSIRLQGRITGLAGLSAGSNYYISSTAGGITSTPPANQRFLGVADSTTSLVLTPSQSTVNSNLTVATLTTTGATTVGGLTDLSGASAGQIKFPATQNPSTNVNTIDDYEELTSWTPVIGGSGGTSGQTYSAQIAKAIKIGKHVTAWFDVTLSNKGTITGAVQIQGLPYTQGTTLGSVHISFWTALGAAKVYVGGIANTGTTAITLYGAGAAATGLTALADADIGNTTRIVGVVVYEADQ
jgi:hypothetical protein